MRGAAFSMTNFVARPLIGLATFISEYTSSPIMLVTILTSINIGSTLIIKEPEEDENESTLFKAAVSTSAGVGREPLDNVSLMNDEWRTIAWRNQ